jgi:hypothetical protein
LVDKQPDSGWTMADLEARATVKNGGLETVLPGAVELGLVALNEDGRWSVPSKLPVIATPLRKLAAAVAEIPDEPIPPLKRRKYRRHRP